LPLTQINKTKAFTAKIEWEDCIDFSISGFQAWRKSCKDDKAHGPTCTFAHIKVHRLEKVKDVWQVEIAGQPAKDKVPMTSLFAMKGRLGSGNVNME